VVVVSVVVTVIVVVIGLVNIISVGVVYDVVVVMFGAGVGGSYSREIQIVDGPGGCIGIVEIVEEYKFCVAAIMYSVRQGFVFFCRGKVVVMITPFRRSMRGGCIIIFTIGISLFGR